jgi:hypothetical protein
MSYPSASQEAKTSFLQFPGKRKANFFLVKSKLGTRHRDLRVINAHYQNDSYSHFKVLELLTRTGFEENLAPK